jgi:hypothetical protein
MIELSMKSPILFIIFKREDTTQKVFNRIREARPPRLYIAADGPRSDREGEAEQCEATRKVVENVDWPCEVYHLYRDKNLGCGEGVSSAITWFFEHEEEGIIIEDDILPHIDFFRFCDEMLEKYRNEPRIKCICGSNAFYEDIEYPYSYFFSHYMMVWGWATWKRTWKEYDKSLKSIPRDSFLCEVKALPIKKGSKLKAIEIYDVMNSDRPIDTWDYQLFISTLHHNGLNVIPINNLCKNIGFGHVDAVHTIGESDKIENHKVCSCFPLKYPKKIKDSKRLDTITFMEMYTPTQNVWYKLKQRYYSLRARLGLRTRIRNFIKLN